MSRRQVFGPPRPVAADRQPHKTRLENYTYVLITDSRYLKNIKPIASKGKSFMIQPFAPGYLRVLLRKSGNVIAHAKVIVANKRGRYSGVATATRRLPTLLYNAEYRHTTVTAKAFFIMRGRLS